MGATAVFRAFCFRSFAWTGSSDLFTTTSFNLLMCWHVSLCMWCRAYRNYECVRLTMASWTSALVAVVSAPPCGIHVAAVHPADPCARPRSHNAEHASQRPLAPTRPAHTNTVTQQPRQVVCVCCAVRVAVTPPRMLRANPVSVCLIRITGACICYFSV